MELLEEKPDPQKITVGVVGMGYVGLPLLIAFHRKGFRTIGFDIDEGKVEALNTGRSYIKQYPTALIKELAQSERFEATSDYRRTVDADALLLCVPTPLDEHREPDMQYIEQTARQIAPNLRKEQLIVLESTTWPGTTEELLIPILEEGSGLKAGTDFYVAYSPEREDPGNREFDTGRIPKVVGGHTPKSLKLAEALYSHIVPKTVPVSDTRTAEAAKLLENIFRSVNIALVNELKLIFEQMDIDVHEVIDAAATKPFGFMKFTPGPGLGGHCIPVDPFYLSWKAREYDMHTRFIELAGEINTVMPHHVVDTTFKALNHRGKPVKGSNILIIGIAYKPDVDDMRESPSFKIMDLLKENGAKLEYYDTNILTIPASRDHMPWKGQKSIHWDKKTISQFDAVVIVTNHSDVDYRQLGEWCPCIIDTRNAMAAVDMAEKESKVWKA